MKKTYTYKYVCIQSDNSLAELKVYKSHNYNLCNQVFGISDLLILTTTRNKKKVYRPVVLSLGESDGCHGVLAGRQLKSIT